MSADDRLGWAEPYQPRSFADDKVFGSIGILEYLQNQVRNRTGRSVIIHGPSGCGKTMHGLLYANGLICDGQQDRPCFECEFCFRLVQDCIQTY